VAANNCVERPWTSGSGQLQFGYQWQLLMTDGPSKYAGLAAVAVFLVGWFIVGNALVRITVLGVAAFIIALAVAQTASHRALVVAVAAAICSALVAYNAAACERTGKANYCDGHCRWGLGTVPDNHRFYCATTADFQQFSASRLFYNPGFNSIDATILQVATRFYLFFKDERKRPLKKNLRYAVADSAEGPYGEPSEPFTGDWVEGPSAIRIRDEYLVYFDHYASPQYYGAARSKDLRHWEDCSKEVSFPKGHRHGTVLRVPQQLAQGLLLLPE